MKRVSRHRDYWLDWINFNKFQYLQLTRDTASSKLKCSTWGVKGELNVVIFWHIWYNPSQYQLNTKHLYNNYTTSAQRLRRHCIKLCYTHVVCLLCEDVLIAACGILCMCIINQKFPLAWEMQQTLRWEKIRIKTRQYENQPFRRQPKISNFHSQSRYSDQ